MTLAKYFRYQSKRLMLLLPVLFCTVARIWAQAASTTTLTASVTTAAWPAAITLTATVQSGGISVLPGLVKFCNASASSCQGPALLGQAQLTSVGKASTKLALGMGSHSIKAVFVGTKTIASSTSSTQTVTLTGLPSSATTLSTAGTTPPYTLTAAVTGNARSALSGNVTFNDASNLNLTLGTAALGTSVTNLSFGYNALSGTAPNPLAMAVGDFNGDGYPDIVLGDSIADASGNYALSVFLSTGPGTYGTPTTVTLPYGFLNAAALAVGDFNNDGNLDLAVAGDNSNEVMILLGNGAGSFTEATIASANSVPNSIVVGDFNGDGNADVAVTNRGSATVSVFLGDGSGGLSPVAAMPATGSFPYWLAIGDFNGDGKQDLAVANFFGGVTILLGNGDGTFTPTASSPSVGVYPVALTEADFNGDGNQDLAVVNQYSKTVTILLGDGKGDFTATPTPPAIGNGANSIATADFNGDGIPDLAVANGSDNTISIFLGKGDGTFPTSQLVNLAAGTGPGSVGVGDFNGDGLEDFAVAGAASNNAVIELNATTTTATTTVSGITVPGSGTHYVNAAFAGNSNYQASVSSLVALSGTIIPTSLSLTVEPTGTAGVGETIQLTATITPGRVGGLVPTGSVTFYNGSTQIGQVFFAAGPPVLYNYTLTAAGAENITAKYSGDTNFTGSASGTVKVTVISPAASSTTLTSSATSIAKGTPLTLTATVASGGAPVTLGTAEFGYCYPGACENLMILGAAQLTAKGTAILKTALPVGTWNVCAFFVGTNDVRSSGSCLQPIVITVTGTLASSTTLAATGTTGNYTLTASVQGSWPPPYGNVSFVDTSNKNLAVAMGTAFGSSSVFTRSSLTPVGKYPIAMAVGDFNGDGKPDLAVANNTSNSVSILLNNGNGTFTADASAIPSTVRLNGPVSIAVGDFNGDGNLDLAVENEGSSTLTILLGTGNGSFTLKSTYPTPTMPYQVVTADFNGDGKLDLATAGFGDGAVAIYLGNGDGTFTLEPESPTFSNALVGLVAADFNGDGKTDLAVADFNGEGVIFLLGNGDGTFVADPIFTNTGSFFMAAVDLNGDGLPDLVVTNPVQNFVTILLNQGGGSFKVLNPIVFKGTPVGVVAADFNGDGLPDLAFADNSGASVTVLLGQGNGTFLPPLTIPLASNATPVGIVSADFNGDGSPDLVVSDSTNNNVATFLDSALSLVSLSGFSVPGAGTHEIAAVYAGEAPYAGSTSSPVALAATQIPTSVTITPVQGWIVNPNVTVTFNVAVLPSSADNYSLTGTVAFYNGSTLVGQETLSNGAASFSVPMNNAGTYDFTAKYSGNTDFAASNSAVLPIHVVPPSNVVLDVSANTVAVGTPVTLTAAVTSDGRLVTKGVVTFCDATAKVCDNSAVLGTASMTANSAATLTLTFGIGTHSVKALFAPTLAEAAASSNVETITVTGKNPTTTTLSDSVVSGTYTLTAKVLADGVHPATGNVSLVDSTSSTTLGTATLSSGSSALSFAAEASLGTGKSPVHVVTGDFNRDGRLDVAVVNYISGTVTILLGNGNGTFTAKSTPTVGNNPQGITVGDFNGDGIPDLAVANLGGTVTILLGNGDGTFTTKSSPAVGTEPIAIATGDFNADGKLDLVVADESLSKVWILLGNGDGTFATPSSVTAGSFPVSVAVADFNGDGRLDLAVVGNGGESVSILLGNGDGTFTAAPTLPDLGEPLQVVAADFNGDGKPDLAVANVNGTLSIFLNKGDGTFSAPTSVTVGINNQTAALVVGDFNQDGKADLAVTSFQLTEAFILLGNGNGTFTLQSTPLKTGTGPASIAAGDFNGDGLPDLAVANYGSNNLSVFVNSLKTSATATLSDVTITGSGNQSVQAKYPGAASFDASNSNALSLPPN